ncbi:LLM class F420-dependent oxidoreductase, partial [Mycolicibacterium smegmatis]
GGDVPVTVCQGGEAAAKDREGYRHLGVERVLLELPTEPRDPTLRYLDKLQAELARLA